MSIHLLRGMARVWAAVIGLYAAFIVAGLAIELLAGMGLAARNTLLWAALHPGWMVNLTILAVLVGADALSRSAHHALQQRESSPMAAEQNGNSA